MKMIIVKSKCIFNTTIFLFFTISIPVKIFPQPGMTCNNSIFFPSGDTTCLDSITRSSAETWYSFYADSSAVGISIRNLLSNGAGYIRGITIYSGICGNLTTIKDTLSNSQDSVISLSTVLIPNENYLVKLTKSLSGTATFNLCLFNRLLPTPNVFKHFKTFQNICGLDYTAFSVKLNQRLSPTVGTGLPLPVNINVNLPAGAIVLGAYLWSTVVDGGLITYDGKFSFTNPSGQTINSLFALTAAGSGSAAGFPTCWNQRFNNTFAYRADVTSIVSGNGNYTLNMIRSVGAMSFDPDGATLLIVYRLCQPGSTLGTLVLWDGLDVLGAGSNRTYSITGMTTSASNANTKGFIIIGDLEDNNTQLSINSSPLTNIAGNFWNFEQQNNIPLPNNSTQANFNILSNSTDCYAFSVMGAYFRNALATCSPPLLCCTPSTRSPITDGTLSSGIGVSLTSATVEVLVLFIINNNFTVNSSNLRMATGAKIVIKSPRTLTITNTSQLFSCSNLWQGIEVEPGAFLVVNNSSSVEDAENAIVSKGGATNAGSITLNTANSSTTGIRITNLIAPPVLLEGNTIPLRSGTGRKGIYLQGSKSFRIQTNVVSGVNPSTTNVSGIQLEISPFNIVHNNTLNFCFNGMHMRGISNPVSLTCNKMISCNRGVFLDNTDIGDQKPTGNIPSDNQWIGSATFDIIRVGGVLRDWNIRNAATYNPTLSPANAITKTLTPATDPFFCPAVPPPCDPACLQNIFSQIASNQIQFHSFANENRFLSSQSVFKQLSDDPALMNQGTLEDAILQRFYDSVKVKCIGKLYDVDRFIGNNNISQAISINTGILPSCQIEINHKDFNTIFLSTLGLGINHLTGSQEIQLRNIAEQCPFTGGRSVYQARTLLSAITGKIFDYPDNCPVPPSPRMNTDKKTDIRKSDNYIVYPNPADGSIFLKCPTEENNNGELLIMDIAGKVIIKLPFNEHENKFNVDKSMFSNGLYFYKIIINGNTVKTDKILMIR